MQHLKKTSSALRANHALAVEIYGAVQGVGFRPFVYQLARQFNLRGFVRNTSQGLSILVEGNQEQLSDFLSGIKTNAPAHTLIQKIESSFVPLQGYKEFLILESQSQAFAGTIALPDLATCPQCLKEIFDPRNRRYRYPFTNCTHCGPRYSILERLPYDRATTSMKDFRMCSACQAEFDDPSNRRFHAQPNACPTCGPRVELWLAKGQVLEKGEDALKKAVQVLRDGKILGFKGLGGFQLFVNAANAQAVLELRKRKHREEKPFALLFASLDLVRDFCAVSKFEEDLLLCAAAPIVLLEKLPAKKDFEAVAPGNPYLGVMLPYTPLHHLLTREFGAPLVATSGNISDEPICIDENEALQRLGKIADFFLVHNRPIVRPLDDSVVRVIKEKIFVLRRARGYAPWPIETEETKDSIFGVGGHYKNTVSLKVNGNVFLSSHIGDLQNALSLDVFKKAIDNLSELYGPTDLKYACDLHPDYFSTRFALGCGKKVLQVQHHHAHIAAVIAEHKLKDEVLGVAWDGTGLGDDKTIWGGEFLLCTSGAYQRLGHLRNFPLPGADAASSKPCQLALGLLFELSAGKWEEYFDLPCFASFDASEVKIFGQMLSARLNSPQTSSMGRLFDVVSSLTGICQHSNFEGQAAMKLEFALSGFCGDESYSCHFLGKDPFVFDWAPMIKEIIEDVRGKLSTGKISMKFHNTLVNLTVTMAKQAKRKDVVLTGGCFQNKYLLEHGIERLEQEGFNVFWPQEVPANDGGLSLGQIVVACGRIASGEN